jgi:hypothetical protein
MLQLIFIMDIIAYHTAWITCYTIIFLQLDALITKYGYARPYYCVHALHNAAIVYLTASEVAISFTHFNELMGRPANMTALQLCFALHIYHIAGYWRSFRMDDWLHHILMIGIALPLGGILPSSALLGFSLFFTTGLPGGIDYALLFAVRNGWVDRMTEKHVNRVLNVWIRSPGCMIQAGFTVAFLFAQPEHSGLQWYLGFIPAVLNYWNGQYFMEQIVVSSV